MRREERNYREKHDDYFSIYSAQLPVLGKTGQKKLREATVLVNGTGRAGTNVTLALAGAGVGHIIGHDPQYLTIDSLNGSILASRTDIGRKKTHVLERSLHHRSHFLFESADTDADFDRACREADLIVSAANSIPARRDAARKAVQLRKPLVDVAVLDGREHLGGHISVYQAAQSDGLACPACLYPPDRKFARGEGLLAPVVAALAGIASVMAVQLLCGLNGDFLRIHNFFFVNFEHFRIEGMSVERRRNCEICSSLTGESQL